MLKLIPEFMKAPVRAKLHERRLWRSQAGQDFWVFGEAFNERWGGYFLDIGAHDGVDISNTYVLEKRYAWSGLCIEANPDTFVQLQANRSAVCVNACLDSEVRVIEFTKNSVLGGIVSPETDNRPSLSSGDVVAMQTRRLEDVLEDNGAPSVIDYISIDVEGAEDRVLLSFPFERYKFNCMTIERPSAEMRARLELAGLKLVKEIPGLDAFYVHGEFMETYLKSIFAFYQKKLVCLNMA